MVLERAGQVINEQFRRVVQGGVLHDFQEAVIIQIKPDDIFRQPPIT